MVDSVLIEAECFTDYGGWVLDQQYMDIMGSSFLLAHGLGNPVKDATCTIKLPSTGIYRIWVRTRDWVAPWNKPGAPGRFQLLLNNSPLSKVFGTEGAEWHWQAGGNFTIHNEEIHISLHDLTGFEGRCDAILFSKDLDFMPPNSGSDLTRLREKLSKVAQTPISKGKFDVVIVGGGIAGMCAAISSARFNLNVALINDRPILGGNNSSDVRVWLGGDINLNPYPRIGDLVKELEPERRAHYGSGNIAELYEDDKRLCFLQEEKITVFLNYRMNKVESSENEIHSVIAENIRDHSKIKCDADWFVDCTGDAGLGYLADADYDITLDGHMGQCNLWNVVETGKKVSFPKCPWAFDMTNKNFPGRQKRRWLYSKKNLRKLGGWYWESGFYRDPFKDDELIRDTNFMAMYGAWDCLKNKEKVYSRYKLNWAAYISGKRESRRLMGDKILDLDDLITSKSYSDGCVPTGWDVDIHLPHKDYKDGFEGNEFISRADYIRYPRPFWIPYRSLYSRNINNLFMAGRNVSVTHEALGAVRVMRTGGMMGEVVGMALSLCKKYGCSPHEVYKNYLEEFLELVKGGVGKY